MSSPRIFINLSFPAVALLTGALLPSLAEALPNNHASFAYVANSDDDTLSIYSVDAQTGRLCSEGYQAAAPGQEAPGAAVVHPNGDFLFVANADTANLSTYGIDSANGRLTPMPATATGTGPHALELAPDGDFLYVTAFGSDAVYTYSVDSGSGALVQVGTPLATGSGPNGIALDPLGRFAYVSTATARNVTICDVDGVTGALSTSVPALSLSPGIPSAIAVDGTGSHAYVTVENFDLLLMYAIDSGSGALSSIGSRTTGDEPADLALRRGGGALYVVNAGDQDLIGYTLDGVTGLATRIPGTFATGLGPDQVVVDPSGLSAYVTNSASRDVSTYTVDGMTLEALPVRRVRGRNTPGAIALRTSGSLSKQGRFLYSLNEASDSVSAYTIDGSTGLLSSAGPDASTAAGPASIAADPTGRFLYSVDRVADRLSTYAIHASTGALTPSPTMLALSGVPRGGAVDPSGRYLYVAIAAINLVASFTLDPITGLPTILGTHSIGAGVTSIAVDPTGQFLYVTRSTGHLEGFRIEGGLASGANFEIAAANFPHRIRFAPTGARGYLSMRDGDIVMPFDIDPATGVPTLVPPGNATGDEPGGAVLDPTGSFAYAPMRDPAGVGAVEMFTVDPLTGELTDLGSSAAGSNPRDVAMDPSGRYLFVANGGSDDLTSFTLDAVTGLTSSPNSVAAGTDPFALVVTSVFVAPAFQDCNSNGTADDLDIGMGTSLDCNANCIPDECEPDDCNANGVPDECDIAFGASVDADMNDIPDECECGSAANFCSTSPHTAGPGGVMGYTGTLDVAANNFSLKAFDCPPQKFGVFFYGTTQIQVPFGEGFRCAGGMSQRINPAAMTNAAGTATRVVNFNGPPFHAGPGAITPGSTFKFQFWFRDFNGGPPDAGFNLTDGLSVTFCP